MTPVGRVKAGSPLNPGKPAGRYSPLIIKELEGIIAFA